jgi:hypothetical protein
MILKRVDEILSEKKALVSGLTPIRGRWDDERSSGWYICGFDSEYGDKGRTLISYQLYGENENSEFIAGPERLSCFDIARRAYALSERRYKKILLPAYYNTAELGQFSTPFWEEPDVVFYQVHPSGLFHIEGKVYKDDCGHSRSNNPNVKTCVYGCKERKLEFEFLYFDLWHFFASMRTNSSLYAVAEKFGLQKLDYDVTALTLDNLNDPNFRAYGLNDAKLAMRIFRTLDDTYRKFAGVSIISRPTPANAALASFRRTYLRTKVRAPSPSLRRLALLCDWGGRVECGFVGGIAGVYEWDADSLYPRSTLLFEGLPDFHDWVDGIQIDERTEGFVHCYFRFPDDEEWPNLPVWSETALYFPLQGESFCTIGELRAAITRGCRYKIVEIAGFRGGSRFEYQAAIRDALHLKESSEGNEPVRAVAKLNMNAGIGKFAQNKGGVDYSLARQYIREHDDELEQKHKNLIYANKFRYAEYAPNGDVVYRDFSRTVNLGSGFYPEWHSLILGKAREVVARAIWALPSYPKLLMVSTDSLHVDREQIGRTEVPFKLEFGPAFFKAIRSRVHVLKDGSKILKIAHHGIPKIRARNPLISPTQYTSNLILMADGNDEVQLPIEGFKTLREAVLSFDRFGAEKVREHRFHAFPDNKRVVDSMGWTHPIRNV